MRKRAVSAAAAVVMVVVIAVGCGDGGSGEAAPPPEPVGGQVAEGKATFTENCAQCHTLADAGTTGVVGPNLDESKPPKALVIERVTNGMGAMPSFTDRFSGAPFLTNAQVQAVADYVSSAAGNQGKKNPTRDNAFSGKLTSMELDRRRLKEQIHELYRSEHEALGERGTLERLERGREWDLAPTLAAGGVAVFPHAGVFDCGHQVAAVVHGCLDSGAERVVVISVLHAFTDEMEDARRSVSAGEDASAWPFWGIQGPGIDGREEWRDDHSLISFRHFWEAETKRRGIVAPEVVERYPYLAGGHPDRLPGIDELAELVEDAVVVSTADPFHHGIGYGDPPERSLPPDEGGLDLAREAIENGMELLARGDYAGYDAHCVEAKSDARDAGQVFRYLRGELLGTILDMAYTDASELYESPPPTWVAAPLVEWQRA